MKFVFSTGSLYTYGLSRCFELAARAGFDGIELMVDERWDTRQSDYITGLVDRYKLPVLAVHSPFSASVPGWPAAEPDRIVESVRLAERLRAEVVVHHLPLRLGWVMVQSRTGRFPLPVPGGGDHTLYRHWLTTGYRTLQATTAVTLCIENMPLRTWLGRRWNVHHWNSPREMLRFPAITMDTTHLGTWGLEPVEVLPQFAGRVRHVHLSNFDGQEHRRPEAGHLRLDRLLAALAADRYAGLISLELHPDGLEAGGPDERVVALLAESLAHCRVWATS